MPADLAEQMQAAYDRDEQFYAAQKDRLLKEAGRLSMESRPRSSMMGWFANRLARTIAGARRLMAPTRL
ncbi:MAG: hypothetical protein IPK19_17690 [Chloroflexi bacterium]|nr:hypothetical protein [Chloroflexota bacterium]